MLKNKFKKYVDNFYKSDIALELSTNARKLFLALLNYSSENGFPEKFRISDNNLKKRTGLNQLELEEARDELIKADLAQKEMEA